MKIGGIFFNLTYIFSTGGSTYLLEEPHTFGRPVHHVNSGPVDGELVDMGDWLECHQDISTGLPRIFEPSTTIFVGKCHRDLSPPAGHPKSWWKGKGTYPPPKCPSKHSGFRNYMKTCAKQFARFVFSRAMKFRSLRYTPWKVNGWKHHIHPIFSIRKITDSKPPWRLWVPAVSLPLKLTVRPWK